MKLKTMAIAAFAMMTLFACSKEEVGKTGGDERAVQIRINYEAPAERSIGGKVGNAAVTFNGGKLLFTDNGDAVTMIVDITNSGTAYNETSRTVGVNALKTPGQWITGVPNTSKKVYFIGNFPGVSPGVGSDVKTLEAGLKSQWNSAGGVANVTLFGTDVLTPRGSDFEAIFDVKPIAARFEVAKITGTGNVTSFQVDGIFMDNYYNAMRVNGLSPSDLKANRQGLAKYVENGTGGSYVTDMKGVVFDYSASGLTHPVVGNAWAYNLLAPTITNPAMPAIVVRLSNVVVNGVPWSDPQFLTIENFYSDPGTNLVRITKMEQGKVYLIPDLVFDEEDLTPEPYQESIRVFIEVDVLDWETVNIGYEFY